MFGKGRLFHLKQNAFSSFTVRTIRDKLQPIFLPL
jgi:hypothetical protein